MTATSHYFGHEIYFNKEWRYSDNHVPINTERRKCPRCNQYQTKEGYDPCCGYIKNAISVCCGHGVKDLIKITK